MTAKHLIELLQQVNPDAEIEMRSLEDPDVGLVPIAIIYDKNHVEIVEDMDSEEDNHHSPSSI